LHGTIFHQVGVHLEDLVKHLRFMTSTGSKTLLALFLAVVLTEDTGRKSTSLVISSDKNEESAFLGEDSLSKEEIRERRKRVHIPSFSQGSTRQAKDWLTEYKNVCHHIRFSEKERLDDLQIRFKGQALSWSPRLKKFFSSA
ncbi:hypothetical protein INT48_002992, partial [Thamnidium elegans]